MKKNLQTNSRSDFVSLSRKAKVMGLTQAQTDALVEIQKIAEAQPVLAGSAPAPTFDPATGTIGDLTDWLDWLANLDLSALNQMLPFLTILFPQLAPIVPWITKLPGLIKLVVEFLKQIQNI